MPTKQQVLAIVGRVRRVWGYESVEEGSNKSYLYRITCPDGHRVQVYSSSSDVNWEEHIWNELADHGFVRDELAFLKAEEDRRRGRIEADRLANENRTQILADRAASLARAAGDLVAQPADPAWLLAKHDFPQTKRVLIEPSLANEILNERNTSNRKLLPSRVERWREVMRNGLWVYTHQGIAFSVDGVLLDGQHRLAAAAQEGFTLDINASVGMDHDIFTKVDTGIIRSAAEAAYLAGKTDFANTYSGAARLVRIYKTRGPAGFLGLKNIRFSNDQIVSAIQMYGDALDTAVVQAHAWKATRTAPKISPIALAAAIFLINDHCNEDSKAVMEDFFDGFVHGTQLLDGDPRLALRNFFANAASSARYVLTVPTALAVVIKCWNDFVSGRRKQLYNTRRDEVFPAVTTP